MSHFEYAINHVLEYEGFYSDNPNDSGGETKYGISKKSYPDIDIENLTLDEAREIYKKDWWDKYGFELIMDRELATKIFSFAINMGASKALLMLLNALNKVWSFTSFNKEEFVPLKDSCTKFTCGDFVNRINGTATYYLLAEYKLEAIKYYNALSCKPHRNWQKNREFLAGWINRALA